MKLAILVGTKTVRAATPVVFGEAGVIGRRLFDDGCAITEKTLVRLGDDCTLNAGVVLQAHSTEDGVSAVIPPRGLLGSRT